MSQILNGKIILLLFLVFFQNAQLCIASPKDIDLLISDTLSQFQGVSDHTCILEKKVNKGGAIFYDPEIHVKYRKPTQYYFKWGKGKFKGQEIIYVAGKNSNKIIAHSGGLFRFIILHLNPEGSIAMKRNHHSLRKSGLTKIIEILEGSYNLFKKTGYGSLEIKSESMIDNKAVWVVQGDFPEGRGFYAKKIILYICKRQLMPLKVTVYDWSDELYEEYTFHNLKLNVGLGEKDFDPENTEYNF